MPKLTEAKENTTQTVVVYGAPKSGKTELVSKLSKEFNLLWFDLENGKDTLFKLPKSQQESVHLIQLPDTKIYPIAVETMQKVIKGSPVTICNEHGKVECNLCKKSGALVERVALNELNGSWIVVVDALTQLANSTMNHLTKHQDDLYKYEWEDYRAQGGLMDKFLSQVQQAKFNIVCISHEAEVEMEDGRKKLVPVAGTTNFSRNTAKYFGHVVYCSVKNRTHTFGSSTTFSNNILTGSRKDFDIEQDKEASLLNIFRATKNVSVVHPVQTLQDLVVAPPTPVVTPTQNSTAKSNILTATNNAETELAKIPRPTTETTNSINTSTPNPTQNIVLPAPGKSALAALANRKKPI